MKARNISSEVMQDGGVRFLLCDSAGKYEMTSNDGECVRSLIQCLNKAMDESPRIIAVCFVGMPIRERNAHVKLCAALKNNRRAKEIPIVALLHAKHRKLMEDLARAQVDYVKFIGQRALTSALMLEIIDALGPDDRIGRLMSEICPYLHYKKIDPRHEMTICGAYQDRMVLGGKRLHEVCETENHLLCEFFLNPRPKK